MMKKIFLVVFVFTSLNAFAQLECKDFMDGEFYIPKGEGISRSFKISRNGNNQIEVVEVNGKEDISYGTIEWIDECTYRLKYDESKMDLSETHKFINAHNGVLVEKIEIIGDCFVYKSTMIIDGKEVRIDGKICKM